MAETSRITGRSACFILATYATDDSGVVETLVTVRWVAGDVAGKARRIRKPIGCPYCEVWFATTEARDDHIGIRHPGERPVTGRTLSRRPGGDG